MTDPVYKPPVSGQTVGEGAPTGTGTNGDEYWDLTNKRLYRSDGGGWIIMAEPQQAYSPVVTASTANPTAGATTASYGWFQRSGGQCTWTASISDSGAGHTIGTGEYRINIPKNRLSIPFPIVGSGWAYLAGFYGLICDASVTSTTCRMVFTGTGPSPAFNSAQPAGGWAAGAVLSVSGIYMMDTPYL
jgi:hypothetical protein